MGTTKPRPTHGRKPGNALLGQLARRAFRDLLAALAMQRLLDRLTPDGGPPLPETVAREAYDLAEHMLRERGE